MHREVPDAYIVHKESPFTLRHGAWGGTNSLSI